MLVPVYITTKFTGYYCFNKNNEKRDKNNQLFKNTRSIYPLAADSFISAYKF